ncbi:MAG: TPM domain-containing protein [Nitrospiraceae bacterium]
MSCVRRELARHMVLIACLCVGTTSWALEVPTLSGRIVDLARILPAEVAADLVHELEAHEAKTGNQVAVLTLPSLEGEPLEEFSHRVATTWKLGQKGTDNGALLLVAMKERRIRIEVGYGLEGTLTDARSAQIIRNHIVPHFRAGDLQGGIAAGVRAILGTIEGTYSVREGQPVRVPTADEPSAFEYVIVGVIVGLMAGLLLSNGLQRTRALLGSVLAFLIAQFASILMGLAAAGVTALLLWLILQANRGGEGDGETGGPQISRGGQAVASVGHSAATSDSAEAAEASAEAAPRETGDVAIRRGRA